MVAKKRGRQAKPPSERLVQVAVRFPPALIERVDAIAAGRLDAPDRSAMVRQLVVEAIEAREGKPKRK